MPGCRIETGRIMNTVPLSNEPKNNAHHTRISIEFAGTNCLLLCAGSTALLIDPHFTRPRKIALLHKIAPRPAAIHRGLQRFSTAGPDAILLTHTHYDHALDAACTAQITGAPLYGSPSAMALGSAAGLPVVQMHAAQPYKVITLGDFKLTFLPTTHLPFPGPFSNWFGVQDRITQPITPPAWFWQYRPGLIYALLLEYGHTRLLVQGSAGIWPGPAPSANAAILSIGGLGLQSAAYRRTWFRHNLVDTGVQRALFSHWDDFMRPLTQQPVRVPGTAIALKHIRRLAQENPGLNGVLLQPGERIEL